jgi:tripartite-type tricarboxylate transporter receptor subunit TctC
MTVTGVELTHVPYQGSAPALNDLIAGRVDVMFDYPISSKPHVDAGTLVPIVTFGAERLSHYPDTPTVAEEGIAEAATGSWAGLMVPAGTPDAVAERLAEAAHIAINSDDIRAHFERNGSQLVPYQTDEMHTFIEEQIKLWARVIESAGITR